MLRKKNVCRFARNSTPRSLRFLNILDFRYPGVFHQTNLDVSLGLQKTETKSHFLQDATESG